MSTPNPIPTVQPLGTLVSIGLTAGAIKLYAGSDTTKELAAAMMAQAVAGILTTADTGNVGAALAQLKTLLGNVSDPGLAVLVNSLWAIGAAFVTGEGVAVQAIPVLSDEIDGWLANTANGMNQVASADIAAYQAAAAKK